MLEKKIMKVFLLYLKITFTQHPHFRSSVILLHAPSLHNLISDEHQNTIWYSKTTKKPNISHVNLSI